MLRSIWIIVATMAIANMLALIGFAAWLGATDRLSMDRLRQIRDILKQTVAQERANEQEREDAEEAAAVERRSEERRGVPPVNVAQRLRIIAEHEKSRALEEERELSQVKKLALDLERREAEFEQERQRFNEQKAAWEAMREDLTALERDEQFQQAVKLYESVKPAQAKTMMNTLIERGEMQRVVAYLDRMEQRKAGKVVSEFEKDDPRLAADLLEHLRTLGVEARLAEGVPDE